MRPTTATTAAEERPAEAARYRGTDVAVYLAPLGAERVEQLLDGREAVVPANTGALLARCAGFRSLDEHARRIVEVAGLGADRVGPVRRRLEELAQSGLLSRYDQVLAHCRAQTPVEPPRPPIGILGVPSCDRSAILARGMRSYLRNSRDYGRDVEFVVVDDSRHASSRDQNRARLVALAREFEARVSYAGPQERAEYVVALARASGVETEVVRFGLLPSEPGLISTGASRSTLLLHAVGERFVHVDDDTLCNVARAPQPQPGVRLVGVHTDMEHSFFASDDEARAAVRFEPVDYIGVYEAVLGRSVAELLGESFGPVDLDEAPTALVRRLQRRPSRVALTSLGVVGDSGFGGADMYFFTANPVSRRRLLAFPGGYRKAFASQQVLRTTSRTTVAESGLCLGIALGIDASELLPPFPPVLRNSDGVFSNVRLTGCPDVCVAYLPWVVEHAPPTLRASSFDATLDGAGLVSFPEILSWFVRRFDGSGAGESAAERLPALGRHLLELGSTAFGDYADLCRGLLRDRLAGMMAYLDFFEPSCGATPDDWRRDVEAYVRGVSEAAESKDAAVPCDLVADGLDRADVIRRGQRLLASYGRLLVAWPALVRSAHELRRRGYRPAKGLS